ncbi:unnamed protein product [Calicophoron daubneyi]
MTNTLASLLKLPIKRNNVALILHGCGVYDGSEISESVSMLIHLSKRGVNCSMFAPNEVQLQVINHLSGEEMDETRNVLIESARIARGKIAPLKQLDVSKFDALLIPGGFGAAKNLSDFADQKSSCTVHSDIQSILVKFHADQKPIGLCCIAPILAARCLPGVELTFGGDTENDGMWPFSDTCQEAEKMGAKHVNKAPDEVHIDWKSKVVTTPAFMCATSTFGNIFDGIGQLIDAVLRI